MQINNKTNTLYGFMTQLQGTVLYVQSFHDILPYPVNALYNAAYAVSLYLCI